MDGGGRAFPARWQGRCNECGEPWEQGSLIRYNPDGDLVGEECCGYQYAEDQD